MEITFEQLPKAVAELHTKLDGLEKLIGQKINPPQTLEVDHWYTINEICKYLPDKPSKPTIYNWIRKGIIPYHKGEKKLRFLKSEIDAWLKGGKQKTATDYAAEADTYLQTLKNKRR